MKKYKITIYNKDGKVVYRQTLLFRNEKAAGVFALAMKRNFNGAEACYERV